MVTLSGLSKQFGDKALFDGFSTTIYDGERVGIVGANGTGKSTLLKIIAGEESQDAGGVQVEGKIGFLKQVTQYSEADFLALANDPEFIREFLEIKSKLHIDSNLEFTAERLKTLSGGEKTKLMLAGILCQKPQILLLDEPTNHMDISGVNWLIDTINSFDGTIITVSHDRYFLNETVSRIIELENGQVQEYYGDYNSYYLQKQQELQGKMNKYESQLALEKKINKQIGALAGWANKGEANARRQGGMMSDSRIKGAETKAQVSATKLASQAKAKVSRLEHLKDDFIDRPYVEGEVHYRLNANPFRGKVLVKVDNLGKSYGGKKLFDGVSFTVNAGDKIALSGDNGSGKTTLIKILLGQEKQDAGDVSISPAVKIAYLSQDVFDLDEGLTVIEKASQGTKEYKTLFLSNLINMNMTRQVFDRKISTLSLGERMRIKMCEIVLSDYNFLIMDEPTNHLDLNNKIFLEKILKDYNGCLLLVSHDRTLTKNVCNATLTIKNGTIKKEEIERDLDVQEK